MGETTGIAWADATFNPWIGCAKISRGCAHCYAERDAGRYGLAEWGTQANRRITSDAYWRKPLSWNNKMPGARVFCGSMCDVFEAKSELDAPRTRLWKLIGDTPNLTWMLLTKRPANIPLMLPWESMPENVWLGASVEDQAAADLRIEPLLLRQATVNFLSCEPLLGPIRLDVYPLQWVIVGGESGNGHRPMEIEWLAGIVQQCQEAKVPVFVKQDSGLWPGRQGRIPNELWIQDLPGG